MIYVRESIKNFLGFAIKIRYIQMYMYKAKSIKNNSMLELFHFVDLQKWLWDTALKSRLAYTTTSTYMTF